MTNLKTSILALLLSALLVPGLALAESDCTDGLDNDADLLVDCNDPGCCGFAGCAGFACDDGVFCTVGATCQAGACTGATPRSCDDGVTCTADSCDEVGAQCVNTTNDVVCDNGEFCDGPEVCNPATDCQPGVPTDCSDGIDCTVDTCDEVSDTCGSVPDDALCDDAAFCNGVEFCSAMFGCESGTQVDCSGSTVGCATGFCNEITDACGVIPDDDACDNGLICDGRETCDLGGACNAGTALDCSGQTGSCGTGYCDELADACDVLPMNEGVTCDDGDPCTPADVCTAGACVAGGTTCGDGALDAACGEQCDPPSSEVCGNLVDDDGDTLIDCLDDDCGALAGPTCNDQCMVVGACKSLGRTRAKIRFKPGIRDQLKLRSQTPVVAAAINPVTDGFRILLSNDDGPIYRGELFPGDIVLRRTDQYRYIDRGAKSGISQRDGLAQVKIAIKEIDGQDTYVFRVKAWSDLSAATLADMTLQVSAVDDTAVLTARWIQRVGGWQLSR